MKNCRLFALVYLALGSAAAFAAADIRLSPPPGEATDCVPLLRDALRRAPTEGGRLVFAPGTYHFFPERAFEKYAQISNHESGLRRIAFPLIGLRDVEIDGGGATFIMHGMITPFLLERTERATIKRLAINWAQPFHLQGTVVAVDAAHQAFELDVLPASNARVEKGQLVYGYGEVPGPRGWRWGLDLNYWMDPVTHAAAKVLPGIAAWNPKLKRPAEITELAPHRFRLAHAASPLPEVGTIYISKGNPNRFAPAIVITQAKDVRVEDVTVHHASGMAVLGQHTENITLRSVRVTPSTRLPLEVSVIADATHFIYCRGTILVEDCLFERMLDDAINVHGIYVIVGDRLSPTAVGVFLSHPQQLGFEFAQPGDVMRFSRRETLLDYGERTVKSVQRVNEEYSIVEFTEPLDGFLQPDSRIENATWQADLTFRRNIVRNNRARSVLVTTRGKVLIEENTFERSSGTVILMEGDAYSWHESGQVADVTIRRNTFIGHSPKAPLIQISPRQPGETRLQPPYHRNIRILDNTFRVVHPLVLNANRAANVRFEGNRVEPLEPGRPLAKGESFHFRASENVTITGNTFGLPTAATIVLESETPGLSVSGNTGLAAGIERPRK